MMVAKRTHDAVMLDSGASLSAACLVDFSLDNEEHFTERFGALQTAARNGATVADFHDALGSGAKITTLVAKYGSNVVFPKTVWDALEEEEHGPDWDKHVDQQAQDSGYEDDEYSEDDGDSAAMELLENQDFAQDGDFENMTSEDGFGSNFG